MPSKKLDYPKHISLNGNNYDFRPMSQADRDAVVNMARHLPEADLAFMRRDITHPEAVDDWVRDIEHARSFTLLVEEAGRLIAYGTLHMDTFYWNRHIGEIRILVSSQFRNRGLGNRLVRELVGVGREHGLAKAIIYMAADDRGARRMVETLGFQPEAVLADWVMMRDGRTKDLLIMAAALKEIKG